LNGRSLHWDGVNIPIGASIGLAHYVGNDDEQSILQRADEAVYLSKLQNEAQPQSRQNFEPAVQENSVSGLLSVAKISPGPFGHQALSGDYDSFFQPQHLFGVSSGIPAIDLRMYPPQTSCFSLTQRANRDPVPSPRHRRDRKSRWL